MVTGWGFWAGFFRLDVVFGCEIWGDFWLGLGLENCDFEMLYNRIGLRFFGCFECDFLI